MRLDALLCAHGFMNVERPPVRWEADIDDVALNSLLGEMIAAALVEGAELRNVTLNVSNVVIEPEFAPEGPGLPPGDYVAITVSSEGSWGSDAVWQPEALPESGWLRAQHARLLNARVCWAYSRRLVTGSAVTVCFRRQQS